MPSRIEDYAIIGDCQTAALVARDGSIDWLCFPRFDSPACFAALLGTPEHGHWQIAPADPIKKIERRYRGDSLILETTYETDSGAVTLIDAMPERSDELDIVRIVAGVRGEVRMRLELILRFDYGSSVPWVTEHDFGIRAVAGPDMVTLYSPIKLRGEDFKTVAEFTVKAGQRVPFTLMWHASHEDAPDPLDPEDIVKGTEEWWHDWSGRCTYQGPYRAAVMRSLITLKALTYAPTGGIVAAPTTSLPEQLGGVRNWDYRYCWLRDATLTLYSLIHGGYIDEAHDWRAWLLRAVAGKPSQMNIMYGPAGERRLTELELAWLPGYEGASPVRIGNAAWSQFQLDVFGEVMDALHLARKSGLPLEKDAWNLQVRLMEHLEEVWQQPDEGIWEVRGPRRHFTHSKVMAWVAFDRAVKTMQKHKLPGNLDAWRQQRDALHKEICASAYDSKRNAFVQYYGADHLDASLLMMPLVGFLPPGDPRIKGTIEAIERELMVEGFIARYPTKHEVDGLPPGEGAFLPCTFWLADCLNMIGRRQDAVETYERLLGLCNDVGLISEEYDPHTKRLIGNFPQAFTHVTLVNTACNLTMDEKSPARDRAE